MDSNPYQSPQSEAAPTASRQASASQQDPEAYYRTGRLAIVYGLVLLIGPILLAFFTDALLINLGSLGFIALGVSVKNGSRRAAKWAMGLAILYLVLIVMHCFSDDITTALAIPKIRHKTPLAYLLMEAGLSALVVARLSLLLAGSRTIPATRS